MLRPRPIAPVPPDTARVARAAFPKGHRSSPSAAEAHDARQHTTPWVGSTVHSPDTCEDDGPPLVTPIDTTPGPASDRATTPKIHAAEGSQSITLRLTLCGLPWGHTVGVMLALSRNRFVGS